MLSQDKEQLVADLAELQGDPLLSRYHTLIIDEAHERSLTIDFLLGRLVVLLAEVHDVHGVGAEGRSHRRRRGGLAGRELDLEDRRHTAATTCLPSWRSAVT